MLERKLREVGIHGPRDFFKKPKLRNAYVSAYARAFVCRASCGTYAFIDKLCYPLVAS